MKHLITLILFSWACCAPVVAEVAAMEDKTLSPYFWVKPVTPGQETARAGEPDVLPLKGTRVAVTIAGSFAEVKVTQRYANTGAVPLEAVYVFPGSTRSAVHGLTLQVGDRRLEARTKEKGEARRTYEAARSAGKTASLLEQQRPNVFQMNVANILPGDEITVELRYTELLVPTDGTYEFVYPGVVGPRYSNEPSAAAGPESTWVANPYLPRGTPDPAAFELHVRLLAGVPLKDVKCRTHSTHVAYEDESTASIRIEDAAASTRDFILGFRLAGEAIQSGLLVAEGEEENFFLLLLEPPARPLLSSVPSREYVFVVDVSGSMNGFPLQAVKRLMKELLGRLRPQDRFNLLLFAGASDLFRPTSTAATEENVAAAIDLLERQSGGGGTELVPALKRALALPRESDDVSRSFLLLTDGYVAVEEETFHLVRNNLGDANVFAFGIGSSVNRELIEGLARAGRGEPFIVTNGDDAPAEASRFAEYVSTPVLARVRASFPGFDAHDVEPAALPDLLASRPLVLFGKWRGEPRGSVVVEGTTGGAPFRSEHAVQTAKRLPDAQGLARLWARSRITSYSDMAAFLGRHDYKEPITALGLKYNLLTRYTSFVAVDEVVRAPGGEARQVKQPLPLPAGVENTAVGGESIGAAPEPSTYALMAVGLLALLVAQRRLRGARR